MNRLQSSVAAPARPLFKGTSQQAEHAQAQRAQRRQPNLELEAPAQTRVGNLLLAKLQEDEQRAIARIAEIVPLEKGQVISEAERAIGYAYFPSYGLVSLQKLGVDGSSIEIAAVSREGMVGVPLILGTKAAAITARVLVSGTALRLRADQFERLCLETPGLRLRFLIYINELFEQIAQGAHCNSLHPGLQRLCRWILMASDRLGTDLIPLTHEALGQILGMPRTGVTRLVTELHDAGAIRCRYGTLTILNRRRLELSACECASA